MPGSARVQPLKSESSRVQPLKAEKKRGTVNSGGASSAKSARKKKTPKKKRAEKQKAKAATIVQCAARVRAARAEISRRRQFAQEMQSASRAALEAQIDYERKQRAKAQKREQELLRKRDRIAARRAQLFEAAADGDEAGVRECLSDTDTRLTVDDARANGDTPLLEAAAAGSVECVMALLDRGARINIQGQHKRTALWRAAFSLHANATKVLLEHGADPRITDQEGRTPAETCSHSPELTEIFCSWDAARTDSLVAKAEERRLELLAGAKRAREQATVGLHERCAELDDSRRAAQRLLGEALGQLRKRVEDHDYLQARGCSGEDLVVARAHIGQAEARVEETRIKAKSAAAALCEAKLQLRLELGEAGDDDDDGTDHPVIPGEKVSVADLEDVLCKDVGGRIRASGQHPLVIDPLLLPGGKTRASIFLRYHDVNYLDALSPEDMSPGRIRQALLGGVRFGKPVVLDIADLDVELSYFDPIFDAVSPGLFKNVVSKAFVAQRQYLSLVSAEDDPKVFSEEHFVDALIDRFFIVFLSFSREHDDEWWSTFYTIEVVSPQT